MVLTQREKSIASTAVIAAVGVGALYLLFNRKKIYRMFTDPLYGQTIHVITSADECQKIVGKLRTHCQEFRVLGFDCEWVNEQGKRHPVALLQLASHRGLCALFRLCELRRIPGELSDLLSDPTIMKVGVGSIEDTKLLDNDYQVKVSGAFDLRYLAEKCNVPGPYGMGRLAEKSMGVKLDKHWRIRASNWEVSELSERQVQYAANDAHVAVELFRKYALRAFPRGWFTSLKQWGNMVVNELECFHDQRYVSKPSNSESVSKKGKKKLLNATSTSAMIKRSMSTRVKPLYDNCRMQAPDGEVLCTCDRKKAEWYVLRGLAEIVTDQPTYTIRLNFEPKGRAVGDVGKYYQTAKENQCVVCGATDSYIRKNVVPRDYRKHFPLVMKEHVSHDVLLLCAPCHRTSTMSDDNMRLMLASKCSAPYSTQENPKQLRVEKVSELRKAARALVYFSDKLPEERKVSLQKKIKKLLPQDTEINRELLEHYANVDILVPNGEYHAHGEKVVEYYRGQPGGLSKLEKMWREHFLQTMKPKYLPELWSVEHNMERLEIRADEGRIEEKDMLIAGVQLRKGSSNGTPTSSSNSYSLNSDTQSPAESSGASSGENQSTARDVSSYRDEEAAFSQSNHYTEYYSDQDGSKTLYGSAAVGASSSSQASNDQFKTLVPSGAAAERDESEMATVNDFASIESSYDSDDSDSTLSQPSMTLLNSTDDWEAEANEPSVNGTIAFASDSLSNRQ